MYYERLCGSMPDVGQTTRTVPDDLKALIKISIAVSAEIWAFRRDHTSRSKCRVTAMGVSRSDLVPLSDGIFRSKSANSGSCFKGVASKSGVL
jgi:hypothetical protein